jgi:hypothetical protein
VAEQFKPDEKVARVGWGCVGVRGYRFEPGDDATGQISSGSVKKSIRRDFSVRIIDPQDAQVERNDS